MPLDEKRVDAAHQYLMNTILSWRDKTAPIESHFHHIYDGSCAVCRFSDRWEARDLLVSGIISAYLAEDKPPA